MKKRVLITGGAGFIAHHTIKHILYKTDWYVVSLDSLENEFFRDFKPDSLSY